MQNFKWIVLVLVIGLVIIVLSNCSGKKIKIEPISVYCSGENSLANRLKNPNSVKNLYFRLEEDCVGEKKGDPLVASQSGITIDGQGKSYVVNDNREPVLEVLGRHVLVRNIILSGGVQGIKIDPKATAVLKDVHTANNLHGILVGNPPRLNDDSFTQPVLGKRQNNDWYQSRYDFNLKPAKSSFILKDIVISSAYAQTPPFAQCTDSCTERVEGGELVALRECEGSDDVSCGINAVLCGNSTSSDNIVSGISVTTNLTLSIKEENTNVNGTNRNGILLSGGGTIEVCNNAVVEVTRSEVRNLNIAPGSSLECQTPNYNLMIPPPRRNSGSSSCHCSGDLCDTAPS